MRVRYNGKVLVPEGPVELPLDQVLTARISLPAHSVREDVWQAAFERLSSFAVDGASISDKDLDRSNIYPDRI